MKVTIMYRNNWFGGDGWTYYLVTIEIKDICPVCGGKRGKPKLNRYCDDGEFYYVHNWINPCGHLDLYKDVYIESAAIPKMASGGIVSGPTLAQAGEYPGANSNPEVIAPWRVKKIF